MTIEQLARITHKIQLVANCNKSAESADIASDTFADTFIRLVKQLTAGALDEREHWRPDAVRVAKLVIECYWDSDAQKT